MVLVPEISRSGLAVDISGVHPYRIAQIKAMTLPQICDREGISAQALGPHISERIYEFGTRSREVAYDASELFGLLYDIYELSKDLCKTGPAKDFATSQNFYGNIFPSGLDKDAVINFRYNLQRYVDQYVHPLRIIRDHVMFRGGAWQEQIDIRFPLGDWVQMPSRSFVKSGDLVEKSVLEEAARLKNEGFELPDLVHSTSSSVLDNISKAGALLSAKEAAARGLKLSTGAMMTEHRHETQIHLSSVYAATEVGGQAYGFVGWFDEYPVEFGVEWEKQDAFLRLYTGGGILPDGEVYGGSYKLGPKVPFSSVTSLFCPYLYLGLLKAWAQKNVPGVPVVSSEAAMVFKELGRY